MRILLRVLAVLAVLGVVLLVAVALILPRVVESDAVRSRIEAAAADATGGELAYAGLDVGLLPPRLVVESPAVRAPGAEEPALAADAVALRVSLLPLLVGAVVVDSLRVDGARVHLERTDAGVGVPGLFPEEPEEPPQPPSAEPSAPEEELRLAVRRVDLADARVELVDRTLEPAVRWSLEEVEGGLRGESLQEPVRIELGGRLASGGSLRVDGDLSLDGAADLTLVLAEVALAPLAPYADASEGEPFEGLLVGDVKLRREAGGDPAVEADLHIDQADVAGGDVSLAGRLGLRASLSGPTDAASGRVAIDATQAALTVEDVLDKPVDVPARLEGPLRSSDGEVRLEDAELVLAALRGTLSLVVGERNRVRLDAPGFDATGFERLLVPLRDYPLRGSVAIEGFEATTGPLELAGRVVLDDVRVAPEGEPEMVVRGALVGRGDGIASEDLVITLAEQAIPVGVRLQGLTAATPHLDLTAKAQGLETGALMAAFDQDPELLTGPLDLDAALGGPLPTQGSILEQLRGRVVFEIAPGTLRGVSFLRSAFGGLGSTGQAALALGGREEKLERFYGDEFERLGGTVQVAEGQARSDDLRLDYGDYHVDLRGTIGLEDLGLDLIGKITIEEEVDRALADGGTGRRRVIPLAHVGGTLAEPRVEVTQEAMLGFAAAYTQDSRRREKWERKIDERLGEGAGEEVLRTLDEILGGAPPREDGEE